VVVGEAIGSNLRLGDDFVWVGGPVERLRIMGCLRDETVDGGLEIEHAPSPVPAPPSSSASRAGAGNGAGGSTLKPDNVAPSNGAPDLSERLC
jgi:hypothetical protein